MDHSQPERLARVEAILETLVPTVNTMAEQVQEVRDYMLTSKGKSAGGWKVLTTIGAIAAGVGTLGAGVGAIAAVYLAH